MAVMFAVAQRKLAQGDPAALEMAKPASSDTNRDALAHYASEFAALGMRNDRGGVETLRHLFVLMFGLGLRESSGRYCEGYDREPNRNRLTSETAEAGLFQMSWDARAISPFIKPLLRRVSAERRRRLQGDLRRRRDAASPRIWRLSAAATAPRSSR